jgi:4-aminobutyrate aminotransferase-like enzyme
VAYKIVQELKERGILTNTIGPDENILKLRPPMVFTKENANFFLDQLEIVVKKFSYN